MKNICRALEGKTVLITGGTGFIGSHLAELIDPYARVILLSHTRSPGRFDSVRADLTKQDLTPILRQNHIDVVFHLAGHLRPYSSSPKKHLEINVTGTKNLLECCRNLDIERFIFASTGSVFGHPMYLPVDEAHPKIPENYYGYSKLLAEILVEEYGRYYHLKTTILRFASVYGPGQSMEEVIPIWLHNAVTGKPLRIFNEGTSSQDFIYVSDVIRALLLCVYNPKAIYQDFNIGTGTETPIRAVAQTIDELVSGNSFEYIRKEPDLVTNFVFNINKANRILNFFPSYDLERGLKEQINYIKEHI